MIEGFVLIEKLKGFIALSKIIWLNIKLMFIY